MRAPRSPCYYDPMIAKLIASGADRHEAIAAHARRRSTPSDPAASGTTCPFWRRSWQHPRFQPGDSRPTSSPRSIRDGFHGSASTEQDRPLVSVAAVIHHRSCLRARDQRPVVPGPPMGGAVWVVLADDDRSFEVTVVETAGGYAVIIVRRAMSSSAIGASASRCSGPGSTASRSRCRCDRRGSATGCVQGGASWPRRS